MLTFQPASRQERDQRLQIVFPHLVQDASWFNATVACMLELRRKGLPTATGASGPSQKYYKQAIVELQRQLSSADSSTSDAVLMTVTTLLSISVTT